MANAEALEAARKVEQMVGDNAAALKDVSESLSTQGQLIEEQRTNLKEMKRKQDDLEAGHLSQREFKEVTERIGTDVQDIHKKLQKIDSAKRVTAERMPVSTWKRKAFDLMPMFDDQGRPVSNVNRKAWWLFNAPVGYETAEGEMIKEMRRLHDIVVVSHSMHLKINPHFRLENLKSYQLLRDMVKYFAGDEDEFVKAMYSTGTGLGDEWVPTGMSSELYDLFQLEAVVANQFPTFTMLTNPYEFPILTARPTAYVATEAAVNNPNQLTASDLATSKVTFNTSTYAVRVLCSPEAVEDSAVAMIPEIYRGMAIGRAHSEDSRVINGDSTTPHFDNGTVTDHYATGAPELQEKGLREIANDLSTTFDAASASAGVGDGTSAFAAKDIRYCRKLCGKLGIPNRGFYLTGPTNYYNILNMTEFTQPGTYGAGATWNTGQITMLDGSPLVISEDVPENLNASGVYDGSTTTQTVIIWANKESFRMGERRGWTVEADKNIDTQQWSFVGTYRTSFQKMTASTLKPVAVGYKITA